MIRPHEPAWAPAWRLPPEARLVLVCILLIALVARPHPVPLDPVDAVHRAGLSQRDLVPSHYYFGGRPVREAGTPIQLGAPAPALSCLAAGPQPKPGVAGPTEIADDLPGLYGAPWVAAVNGYLMAALHVTVPRNRARQPPGPVLQIYRRGAVKPVFSASVPVGITRGSDALLYRMFVNGPIACIDLVIPNDAGAGTAHVYYPFRGRMFETEGYFTVQR